MQFEIEESVDHPASIVLGTMMHQLEELTPYRSRLDRLITEHSETLSDGRFKVVRRSEATVQSVPLIFRAFINEGMLSWTEEAIWSPEKFCARWTIRNTLAHLYNCTGVNFFEPHSDNSESRTRIRITGHITIYPDKIPGVPTFVASRLIPKAEKLIVQLIKPDLIEVASALQKYLDKKSL
jgi:hypothetical protein